MKKGSLHCSQQFDLKDYCPAVLKPEELKMELCNLPLSPTRSTTTITTTSASLTSTSSTTFTTSTALTTSAEATSATISNGQQQQDEPETTKSSIHVYTIDGRTNGGKTAKLNILLVLSIVLNILIYPLS